MKDACAVKKLKVQCFPNDIVPDITISIMGSVTANLTAKKTTNY